MWDVLLSGCCYTLLEARPNKPGAFLSAAGRKHLRQSLQKHTRWIGALGGGIAPVLNNLDGGAKLTMSETLWRHPPETAGQVQKHSRAAKEPQSNGKVD